MRESEIQKAVFEALQKRGAPNIIFWHHPNTPAARRLTGYQAGVSDIIIVRLGRIYALELKVSGNPPSEEQMEFVSRMNSAGGYGCIVHGLPQALKALETWDLIRPEAK